MTDLFYLVGLFALMYELANLIHTADFVYASNTIRSSKGKNLSANLILYCFFMLLYMIWSFVGLVSSQWILFLILIIFSLVIPKKTIGWRIVDSVLSATLLLFILLNKFHLHYSMRDLLHLNF